MAFEFKSLPMRYFSVQGERLINEQYLELTLDKDIVKLNVDWEKYFELEKSGILQSLGMWSGADLIGYSLFFISSHPHYKDLKVASNDIIFLDKKYRKAMNGIRLIKESEKMLWKKQVEKIAFHCKHDHPLADILRIMGYMDEEIVMYKIKR